MMEVDIIRTGYGTIQVAGASARRGPCFTRAVLDVAGGLLTWPRVDDEMGLPVAEIDDVHDAQQWLSALYGERVSIACATVDREGLRVPAEETTLARDAARLAFGHWAARWWPASYMDQIPALDADLLGAELAALAYQCQQLFDPYNDGVTELIEEHQAGIDRLMHWHGGASASAARSIETVLRLIDDAADNMGLDTPPLRRLRSAIHRSFQPCSDLSGALNTPSARYGDYALAAAGPPAATSRVIARGTGINDWPRYPPGLVDAAEDAISWVARAVGARRQIEISAVAGAAAAWAVPLVAEVRVDGGAPSRVPLARRDDVWAGLADLAMPPTGQAPIEVTVLLPGFDPGPGGGDSPDDDPNNDDPNDGDPHSDGPNKRDLSGDSDNGDSDNGGPDDSAPDDGGRADRDAIRALTRRRLSGADDGAVRPFLAEIAASQNG